jgi:hypothetical protein
MKVRVVEDDECCQNSYPDLLVIRGQFRKSRAALCGGSPLIRHQRLKPNAAMGADLPIFNLPFVQELNQGRPRDVQHVRCLLRSEFLMDRNQGVTALPRAISSKIRASILTADAGIRNISSLEATREVSGADEHMRGASKRLASFAIDASDSVGSVGSNRSQRNLANPRPLPSCGRSVALSSPEKLQNCTTNGAITRDGQRSLGQRTWVCYGFDKNSCFC